ncbi:hypothetical protein [Micromonospora inositola]|uniref:hypothetical protein n=1 Tax=Micromonospora inositola TaxID=47865 RepID=UPI0012FD056B|nr:hypothetical protein [Micromonospora inositola]
MLPVAFAPPLWAATLRTLRKLTRLAVTALVLVAGLGGATASAAPAEAFRPTAEPGQVAAFQVAPVSFVGPATADRSAGAAVEWVAAPSGASAAERITGTPGGRPAGAAPERPARRSAALSPAPASGPAPVDPGRDAVGRRGPPRG